MGRCYFRRLAMHAGVTWIPYIWDSTLVGINTGGVGQLWDLSLPQQAVAESQQQRFRCTTNSTNNTNI